MKKNLNVHSDRFPTRASADTANRATRHRRRLPRGMLRRREAAGWSGVSLRTWATWESAGLVPRPTARIGSVVLYSLRTLRLWRDLGCVPRQEFEALIRADLHAGQHAPDRVGANSHGRRGL